MPISALTDLPGLVASFNAQDASTLDASEGLSYTWTDEFSAGFGFATQTNKPLQIVDFNGKRYLRIVGVGGWIRCDALATSLMATCTLTIVAGPSVDTSSAGLEIGGGGSSASNTPIFRILTSTSKVLGIRRNDANTVRTLTSTPNADTLPAVYHLVMTGTTLLLYRNGALLASGSASGTMTLDQFGIGVSPRTSALSPADLIVAAVVVRTSALDATQVLDEANFLANLHVPAVADDRGWPSTWSLAKQPKLFRMQKTAAKVYSAVYSLGRNRYDGSTGKYWVDWVNGNDSNPGSQAQPYKTIGKALEQSDFCFADLAPGLHPASGGTPSWNSTYTRPGRGGGMSCTTGRAIIANAENSIVNGWALEAGSTYKTTRTAATTRVVDLTWLNSDDEPQALTSRASIALVDANPGSYFSDSGTGFVYVRTFDSRSPDVSVIVQIGTQLLRTPFNAANRFWHLENITIVGGDGGQSAGDAQYDFANCCYYYKDFEWHFGTEHNNDNAFEVNRDGCRYSNTSSDANDYGGTAIGVEANGFSGSAGAADSDNATTGHESAAAVRFNMELYDAHRIGHDIGASLNWYCKCTVRDARTGGARTGAAISSGLYVADGGSSQTTKTTVEYCIFSGNPVDLQVSNGARIDCIGISQGAVTTENEGSGTITFSEEPVGGLAPLIRPARRRRFAPLMSM